MLPMTRDEPEVYAFRQLSKLVDRAAGGEEFIIAKGNEPMARLVPFAGPRSHRIGGHRLRERGIRVGSRNQKLSGENQATLLILRGRRGKRVHRAADSIHPRCRGGALARSSCRSVRSNDHRAIEGRETRRGITQSHHRTLRHPGYLDIGFDRSPAGIRYTPNCVR